MSEYTDDMQDYDPEDEEYHQQITCKFCGIENLAWEEDSDGKWILYSTITGEVHHCRKLKNKPLNVDIDKLLNEKIK